MVRITVLQKPNGGVRGIVAGDAIRRLFSRSRRPSSFFVRQFDGQQSQYLWDDDEGATHNISKGKAENMEIDCSISIYCGYIYRLKQSRNNSSSLLSFPDNVHVVTF